MSVSFFCVKQKTAYEMRISDLDFRRVLVRSVEILIGASSDDILAELARPTPDRLLVAAQALREGLSVEEIHAVTKYDRWFLERIEEIIEAEPGVCDGGLPQYAEGLRRLKSMGFSDKRLAWL